LVNVAHVTLAERAILREQTRFLHKVNNEAKDRRTTKAEVVGKARVMSYEDIKEARAKLAAKKEAAASKGKRGRKRKHGEVEPDASEPRAPVARMI
jgi:hypothetical protein